MNKERYKEECEEGSDLLWPSEKEDKVTRKFYRDLSRLTKNETSNNSKRLNFFVELLSIINFENQILNNLKFLYKFFRLIYLFLSYFFSR